MTLALSDQDQLSDRSEEQETTIAGEVVGRVLATTAAAFGLETHELCDLGRSRHTVHARQVAAYLLRQAGLSLPAIGRALGGRDHTTVVRALARVRLRMEQSPALRRRVEDLADRLSVELGPRPSCEPVERVAAAAASGAVAIVHPRLSPPTAGAMCAAGFTRLADTGLCEVWIRRPGV